MLLCEKGHLMEIDCHQAEPTCCHDCLGEIVWRADVDETNGADEVTGLCPGEVLLEKMADAKWCECEKCGVRHMSEPERYKIPGGGQHEVQV